VYKAKHALLRRPTAIKLLHSADATHAAVARFEREVQLTSQLEHPNTIAIYDYGRTPEGTFYYAMEYLDGITLEDLVIAQGPLPEGRVIFVLRQVCGALAEAHGIGLIHRDVKPANIVLNHRGGLADFVKVLDFGLVKAVVGSAQLTAQDMVIGTPLYMAPEAIEHPEKIDHRTDIYAVGAVGYFLLTGAPVFSGKDTLEICRRHIKDQPQPPSERINRPVSPDLEALILRCLAKKPDDRPATAMLLVEELGRCAAAGTWARADAETWWRARKLGGVGTTPHGGIDTENQPTRPITR
jgi:eukaryotic-like serine/threonine-protein kinase